FFQETFARCCSYHRLNHEKPERSYSVLSRSNQRAAESTTDSGSHDHTVQTNTSSHKTSSLYDSPPPIGGGGFHHHHGRSVRCKPSSAISRDVEATSRYPQRPVACSTSETPSSPQHSPTYLSIQLGSSPTRLGKFMRLFRCIAYRTFDDNKRLSSSYCYSSAVKEPNIFELQRTLDSSKGSFKRSESYQRPCISNSSLRDIETGAIEDELTIYMNELKHRELCS
ncbi:unnamed protein product, partial [Callosobruchus maculatus]